MTWLIYMPYFANAGQGVIASQAAGRALMRRLMSEYETKLSILNQYDVKFLLRETMTASEDRADFIKSIWGQYDFIMIESTKVPTTLMINSLMDCEFGFCTQDYRTNIMLHDGTTFKFPAHKCYTDKTPSSIREGCVISEKFNLRYCTDADDFCDVTDLGIIKISRASQLKFPDAVGFENDPNPAKYNTQDRLHDFLRPYGVKWHRHKELAKRNELYHHRNARAGWFSEYLTESEMKAKLGV